MLTLPSQLVYGVWDLTTLNPLCTVYIATLLGNEGEFQGGAIYIYIYMYKIIVKGKQDFLYIGPINPFRNLQTSPLPRMKTTKQLQSANT